MRPWYRRILLPAATLVLFLATACSPQSAGNATNPPDSQQGAKQNDTPVVSPKPMETVKVHVAAKSLTFLPFYFGQSKGFYKDEGLNLEFVVMKPPIGIAAVESGDVAYSTTPGIALRSAIQGSPIRSVMFVQTRLSFSVIGQPGMTGAKVKTLAVSGLGSTAHYAAQTVMKSLGRGEDPTDTITYIGTNQTGQSYNALTGKTVDAALLSPPYTAMATEAGYVSMGDTFAIRDFQGGLSTSAKRIKEQPEQVKAMIRGTLRSIDFILKNENEVVDFLEKEFNLDKAVAKGSYQTLKAVFQADGDVEDDVLDRIIADMKKDAKVTKDVPRDTLVDLSLLREVRAKSK